MTREDAVDQDWEVYRPAHGIAEGRVGERGGRRPAAFDRLAVPVEGQVRVPVGETFDGDDVLLALERVEGVGADASRVVDLAIAERLDHRLVALEVLDDHFFGRALFAPVVGVAREPHELTRLELNGGIRAGPDDRRIIGEEVIGLGVRDLLEGVALPDVLGKDRDVGRQQQ